MDERKCNKKYEILSVIVLSYKFVGFLLRRDVWLNYINDMIVSVINLKIVGDL